MRFSDEEKTILGHDLLLCLDCSVDTFENQQYYMLLYRLWRAINYKMNGMLAWTVPNCASGDLWSRKISAKLPLIEHRQEFVPLSPCDSNALSDDRVSSLGPKPTSDSMSPIGQKRTLRESRAQPSSNRESHGYIRNCNL
jgi:hypothetical protein